MSEGSGDLDGTSGQDRESYQVDDDRLDTCLEALQKIASWADAYPLDIFPEPDLVRARELLAAGGITLDSISAHCMRHVIEGVGKIAKEALADSAE